MPAARTKAKAKEKSNMIVPEHVVKPVYVVIEPESSKVDMSVSSVANKFKNRTIITDILEQRGDVWHPIVKGMFIRALIRGVQIPPLYFNKAEKTSEALDGQQRIRTISGFIHGEFSIHKDVPPIRVEKDGVAEDFVIARLYFKDLPTDIQDKLKSTVLLSFTFFNMTHEEKVNFFIEINSNKPISPADFSRIRICSRHIFIKLAKLPGIASVLKDSKKKKLEDEDIPADAAIMAYASNHSLMNDKNGRHILWTQEITPEQEEEMTKALDYMKTFFVIMADMKKMSNKIKNRKTHMVSLMYMAIIAIQRCISAEDFAERVKGFFNTNDDRASHDEGYNNACSAASAKLLSVSIRRDILRNVIYRDIG